ncbi:hypothetical protein [Polaromonas sp.]|uniref:hypothetical protein n=1 Tax=Polaromonas sp. TaxID=1869339 RepID=UPI0017F8453F|nr:hypothetical protein [Polaromonas sp.]NMM05724.1 hypothetical protein [Polaromonas sp.]
MKPFFTHRSWLAASAGALLLAACGSGGDSGSASGGTAPGSGSEIPLSATSSSAGAFSFVESLVAAGDSETAEPLQLGGDDVSLGSSDTDDADPSV